MRKCASCGYLLLADGDTCRQCGAALSAPAPVEAEALVGAPSRAPAAAPLWTPRTLPSVAPPTPLRPSPLPPVPTGTPWQPPVTIIEPSRGRTRSTPRAVIVLAVIVLVIGALGFAKLRAQSLPPGTSAFVSGQGVEYSPADNAYTVRFPSTPTETSQPFSAGSASGMLEAANVSTDDYEMGAANISVPVVIPVDK